MKPKIMVHSASKINNFGDTLMARTFADWLITEGADPISDILDQGLSEETRITPVENNVDYDGLVFCGGGYFGEPPKNLRGRILWGNRMISRHLSSAFEARKRGKPYTIVGVGAGPVTNPVSRLLLRQVINNAESVIVRDYESKEFLERISARRDIECGADAALISPIVTRSLSTIGDSKKSRPLVCLHLVQQSATNAEWSLLLDRIQSWLPTIFADLQFVSDQSGSRPAEKAITEVTERFGDMENVTIHPYDTMDGLIRRLANSDLVITTKLHVAIVSARLNCPVLSFACHTKTERFFRQLGVPEHCLTKHLWTRDRIDRCLAFGNGMIGRRTTIRSELIERAKALREVVSRFVKDIKEAESASS